MGGCTPCIKTFELAYSSCSLPLVNDKRHKPLSEDGVLPLNLGLAMGGIFQRLELFSHEV